MNESNLKTEEKNENIIENETKNETQNEVENKTSEKTENPKRNKILKAVKMTGQVLFWIFVILVLMLLALITISKKKDVFGYRLYVMMSGSMEPEIQVKQAVITKKVNNPQVGDVIAFQDDNFVVVHRIINIVQKNDEELYQTKGDNNNAIDDDLVKKENIQGKVTYILPGVGEAILFLQKNIMWIVISISVLMIIILTRRFILNE